MTGMLGKGVLISQAIDEGADSLCARHNLRGMGGARVAKVLQLVKRTIAKCRVVAWVGGDAGIVLQSSNTLGDGAKASHSLVAGGSEERMGAIGLAALRHLGPNVGLSGHPIRSRRFLKARLGIGPKSRDFIE